MNGEHTNRQRSYAFLMFVRRSIGRKGCKGESVVNSPESVVSPRIAWQKAKGA